jgi:hypothetical protein
MGVPVTVLSANTQSRLGSDVIGLTANETYLVVPWSEVRTAIKSNSETPNSLEDWIAAITYALIDRTLSDTNNQGGKITAARRFAVGDNGRGVDEGNFESGLTLAVYSAVIAFYAPDTNPTRPTAFNL